MAKAKEQTSVNSNFTEVTSETGKITGTPPGSTLADQGYNMDFEDLGRLMAGGKPEDAEGQGQHVVVLMDRVAGAEGIGYKQGQVLRVSKLVNNYAIDDDTRNAVHRLVLIGAIRKASQSEIAQGFADVTGELESPALREERMKRMALEEELAAMKQNNTVPASAASTTTTSNPKTADDAEWEDE